MGVERRTSLDKKMKLLAGLVASALANDWGYYYDDDAYYGKSQASQTMFSTTPYSSYLSANQGLMGNGRICWHCSEHNSSVTQNVMVLLTAWAKITSASSTKDVSSDTKVTIGTTTLTNPGPRTVVVLFLLSTKRTELSQVPTTMQTPISKSRWVVSSRKHVSDSKT